MVDREVIIEWIEKADEDFNFADAAVKDNLTFFSQICFHFHQAGEKYLKAFIVANELEFKKIHDLKALIAICVKKDPEFESLLDDCLVLNRYYVDTRYPVNWPTNYTLEEAQRGRDAARKIRDFVKSKL